MDSLCIWGSVHWYACTNETPFQTINLTDIFCEYTVFMFQSVICVFAHRADPGLRAGSQYWRWDDRLRGDPLVPGAWGHSELDALHPDWQDNRSCYSFSPPSLLSAQYGVGLFGAVTVFCLSCENMPTLVTGLSFFEAGLYGTLWVSSFYNPVVEAASVSFWLSIFFYP